MCKASFVDIMEFICAENKEPELFSSVTWALWNRRNNLRLGKQAVPLDKLLEHARHQLPETLPSLEGPAPEQVHYGRHPPQTDTKLTLTEPSSKKKTKFAWELLYAIMRGW